MLIPLRAPIIVAGLLTGSLAAAVGGAAQPPSRPVASSDYLYVWTASADSSGPDFLAVYDIREQANAARYGALVTTVAVPGRSNGPHHTEHDMPADGRLFANGFRSGQSFVFDLYGSVNSRGAPAGYRYPHTARTGFTTYLLPVKIVLRMSSSEIISSCNFSPALIPISLIGEFGAIADARSSNFMLGIRGT